MIELSHHERAQLKMIGGPVYGKDRLYWWGKKTMPKLAAKGLVEPHPDNTEAWRITDAGRKEYERLFGGKD